MFKQPNKKGVSTFVIGFIFFYSILAVLGIVYASSRLTAGEILTDEQIDEIKARSQLDENSDSGTDTVKRSGVINYLKNLVVIFVNTPWWLNALLFIPLLAIVIYAVFVDVI